MGIIYGKRKASFQMGEEIPPVKPIVEPDKVWCVITDFYYLDMGLMTCIYASSQSCCVSSAQLALALDFIAEYGRTTGLCRVYELCYEVITEIYGPYDDFTECYAGC